MKTTIRQRNVVLTLTMTREEARQLELMLTKFQRSVERADIDAETQALAISAHNGPHGQLVNALIDALHD